MSKIVRFYEKMLPYFDGYRISLEVRDFMICQFALESNYGNSRLAVESNNYCGMKYPKFRFTKAIVDVDDNGFAKYHSIQDCVADYLLCVTNHVVFWSDCRTVENFKVFISKWYCPEKSYINKITKIFNQLKNSKS